MLSKHLLPETLGAADVPHFGSGKTRIIDHSTELQSPVSTGVAQTRERCIVGTSGASSSSSSSSSFLGLDGARSRPLRPRKQAAHLDRVASVNDFFQESSLVGTASKNKNRLALTTLKRSLRPLTKITTRTTCFKSSFPSGISEDEMQPASPRDNSGGGDPPDDEICRDCSKPSPPAHPHCNPLKLSGKGSTVAAEEEQAKRWREQKTLFKQSLAVGFCELGVHGKDVSAEVE